VAVGGSLGHESITLWRAGRQLRAPVALRRPVSYLNPGVSDQEVALAQRGIALLGSVKSAALVKVTAHGSPLDECASAVRSWVRRLLAREVGRWGGQSAAIATAILIGDRAGLGAPIEERLRQAGTYHVIAISGGNIAVLAAAVLLLLRLAGRSPAISAVATIAVLLAYGLVVTGGESVARATLAAVVYFAARVMDHRAPGLNLLWVTAGLLVAWDPLSLIDVAFVLTFGATLGILIAAQPIASWLQEGLLR
jgi:competence protein ComEC